MHPVTFTLAGLFARMDRARSVTAAPHGLSAVELSAFVEIGATSGAKLSPLRSALASPLEA
jgi:hypothetical protein